VAADVQLADLRADATRRVPDPPGLDRVVEEVGRQQLAAYYLYSALIAGLIGDNDLAPARWPPELAQPMQRLALTGLAPRTPRGLVAQLTAAEQETRRSPGRQQQFAQLVVDLINHGAFGPLCGDAGSVRLVQSGDGRGFDLELIKDTNVVGTCKAEAHWELVAQYLAFTVHGHASPAGTARTKKASSWLKETGISHAVSTATTLAVSIHPLGAAAGLGTRVVRSRIQAGRDEADALHQLGQTLGTLRAQAYNELSELQAGTAGRN